MKTKEEVIEEAWGKYFKKYKPDENGWSKDRPQFMRNTLWFDAFKLEIKEENSVVYYRPKSVKGIENNNSWIRIESEADLPICEELHLYNIKDKKYYRGVLCGNDGRLDYYATHYAPIEKKESPIF